MVRFVTGIVPDEFGNNHSLAAVISAVFNRPISELNDQTSQPLALSNAL